MTRESMIEALMNLNEEQTSFELKRLIKTGKLNTVSDTKINMMYNQLIGIKNTKKAELHYGDATGYYTRSKGCHTPDNEDMFALSIELLSRATNKEG